MQEIALINPHKRGSKKRRARRGRKRNPSRSRKHVSRARHRFMRRRRNPAARFTVGGIQRALMPALWGGVGAVGTDIAYRMLPVPGALSILKGPLAPVTKIGVAFGVAWVANMVGGRNVSKDMLSGSLAVIAYGLINDLVLSRLPVMGAPVAGYEMMGLGYNSPGAIVQGSGQAMLPDSAGEYVNEYVSGYEYA
jgi:hypothetical protein